jgi:hypothetical protein
MSIAGKVGVNAYADGISAGASASVDIIDADATYTSVARVEIGGSVSVSATAINGAAKAYVDQISASASYNATASVSIDGDLDLRALGEDRAWAGIGEFSDEGSVDGISASAYDGGAADVSIFGDVDVNATATSSGTATAMVGRIGAYAEGTSAHASVSITGDVTVGAVGEDHAVAFVGYVSAYASVGGYASNAIADVTIAGGLHVHATATNANGDAYAYVSGIAAFASNDAQAHVTIGPAVVPADFDAVTVHAEGRDNALAYVPIHAYATSGNASAEIVINGNVRVSASAVTNDAIAMLFVGAGVTSNGSFTESGDGRVEINGDISVRANGQADVSAFAQIIARDSGSVDVTGSVNISVDGGLNPEAKLDIFAGVDNAVDIGNLNVYVGGSSGTADVFVQRPVTWTEVDDFLTHGSSSADIGLGDLTAFVNMYGHANFYMGGGTQSSSNPDDISWDINRMASLSGDGGVYMQLFDQIFGTIDASGLTGGADHLNLEYDLGDHDFATVGTGTEDAHVTTIVGFSGSGTNIMFNTTNPAGGNFTALATESGTADAFIGVLNAALDTKNYVFAVYGGTDDINGDGNVGGDGGNGFLAYDQDGNGITAVLMLPGVTTLAHTDIHNLITPP